MHFSFKSWMWSAVFFFILFGTACDPEKKNSNEQGGTTHSESGDSAQESDQASGDDVKTTLVSAAGPTGDHFLHLSDIHLNLVPSDCYCGGGGTDTPVALWNRVQRKVKDILNSKNPPKFIVFTGDLPAHGCDTASREKNIKTVFGDLQNLIGNTPFFYAPGNNDGLSGDYASFSSSNGKTPISILGPGTKFPAPNAAKVYSKHPKFGYYSASPFKGLRIIALNTIMLYHGYVKDDPQNCPHPPVKGCTDDEREAQVDWLEAQLDSAAHDSEKVYLIMHIPPGRDGYKGSSYFAGCHWKDRFLQLISGKNDVISGILYGHTHMDELKRFESAQTAGTYAAVGFSSPGIGTCPGNNNPGFRTVYYNQEMELVDNMTFYLNDGDTTFSAPYSFWEVYDSDGTRRKSGETMEHFIIRQDLSYITGCLNTNYKVGKSGSIHDSTAIDAVLCSTGS